MSVGPVTSGGCASGFQASREANGDFTRGFASFDISDLHGAEIVYAGLNLTDYSTRGDPFDIPGFRLGLEQVEFSSRCNDAAYDAPALYWLQSNVPESALDDLIDVTRVLADYLESDSPEYFQIRMGWEEGSPGDGSIHGIQWGPIALVVDYIP